MLNAKLIPCDWKKGTSFPFGDMEKAFGLLENLDVLATANSYAKYPPHNVRISPDNSQAVIEIAAAGFAKGELEITSENDVLKIRGAKKEEDSFVNWIWSHKGLAKRPFTLNLPLNGKWQVKDASFAEGILTINLERPEAMKARTLVID